MSNDDRTRRLRAALSALLLPVFAGSAAAQPLPCGPRAEIVARLGEGYGERPVGRGISQGGTMVELLVGKDGSWTLLVTSPGGRACLVSAGEGWEAVALPEPGEAI